MPASDPSSPWTTPETPLDRARETGGSMGGPTEILDAETYARGGNLRWHVALEPEQLRISRDAPGADAVEPLSVPRDALGHTEGLNYVGRSGGDERWLLSGKHVRNLMLGGHAARRLARYAGERPLVAHGLSSGWWSDAAVAVAFMALSFWTGGPFMSPFTVYLLLRSVARKVRMVRVLLAFDVLALVSYLTLVALGVLNTSALLLVFLAVMAFAMVRVHYGIWLLTRDVRAMTE